MSEPLSGRALDAAVAERVMGWRVISEKDWLNWHYLVDVKDLVLGGDGLYLVDRASAGCRTTGNVFSPSSDDNDTRKVRAEIERRGLQHQLIVALMEEVNVPDQYGIWFSGDAFVLLNASPEQQCRAALKAVEGAHA